jgi:hypothetical protein
MPDTVFLRNTEKSRLNPATEEKQDSIITAVESVKTAVEESSGTSQSSANTAYTEATVRISDDPVYGDSGPIQQHEKEAPNYPAREILTFDTNLQNVIGTQRLLSDDNKKIKVETANQPNTIVFGRANRGNDEVSINLNGLSTIAVQLSGTWAGTMSFYGTIDYVTWYAWTCVSNITATAANAISTTSSGIWTARVAGLQAFKVQFTSYTSGQCQVNLSASNAPISYQPSISAWAYGSQSTLLVQKATTYEQTTYDTSTAPSTGAIKDALQFSDPWNPRGYYYVGDTCSYNGQIYQCILEHTAVTTLFVPTNATYWRVDQRQSKSLVTKQYCNSPDTPRLKIELDLDAYQYRLQEIQAINQAIQLRNEMIYRDYDLTIQQDYGGQYGKKFYLMQDGMSHYISEEIR